MNRDDALRRIAELADEHGLSPDEVSRAVAGERSGGASDAPDWVRTLLALIGGLLVLAGLVGMLQLLWDDLTPATRVITVFGSGLVLLVLGLIASRDRSFERAAAPLLLVAGLFQTSGLFVLLNEYSSSNDEVLGAMLVFGVMSAQFAVLFGVLKRTDLLFLLIVAVTLFLAATMAWLDIDAEVIALVLGGSGLLLSYGLERTSWRGLCGLAWFAYAALAAIGLYETVEGAFPFDLLLIAAAALLIQLSVRVSSRPLLVTGVLVMLAYLGYYTREYFADVLGWPIALIAFGLLLITLSGYAVRLGRGMRTS